MASSATEILVESPYVFSRLVLLKVGSLLYFSSSSSFSSSTLISSLLDARADSLSPGSGPLSSYLSSSSEPCSNRFRACLKRIISPNFAMALFYKTGGCWGLSEDNSDTGSGTALVACQAFDIASARDSLATASAAYYSKKMSVFRLSRLLL